MTNGTMLQGFEWELPDDGRWWRRIRNMAFRLSRQGFSAVWLPPAYKGSGGSSDVGYGIYDLYDLGEFPQKHTIRTKYGTKEEYLSAIRALQAADIQALADVVLNHKMGADGSETVSAWVDDPEHRDNPGQEEKQVTVFTRFTFPGRAGVYSDFTWDHTCFTGVDWDEGAKESGLFRFKGKQWAPDVDKEKGNYDYLMGDDVDVCNQAVAAELQRWGCWYADVTGCDGFRLDAVKHISASFYRDWLPAIRRHTGRELYAVGEYWHTQVEPLTAYLTQVDGCMNLFDAPLHQHLREASSSGGRYDMSKLFEGTLVGCMPHQAVTFVDNHDTQPGQSLESWVEGWFKATAYGLILLRAFGYPCVFLGDWQGIPARKIAAVPQLPQLLRLRRTHAYGEEHDYFDHPSVIGFTREGVADRPGSGLAFLCTNAEGGEKRMFVGKAHAGRVFRCVMGGSGDVTIDGEGNGVFRVRDGGVSVYVPRMTLGEYGRYRRQQAARDAHLSKRYLAWLRKEMHRERRTNG